MNDDLHERPVDVATFETDTAQNRALQARADNADLLAQTFGARITVRRCPDSPIGGRRRSSLDDSRSGCAKLQGDERQIER